jgi:hypothetical protein
VAGELVSRQAHQWRWHESLYRGGPRHLEEAGE